MELNILYEIQKLHSDWLDPIMIFFTNLTNHGEIWIAIAVILLCFKKTRKCGLTMGVALILMQICGNVILKQIFTRSRPCWIDPSVTLLIECPTSYSFPSGHTYSSFAGAFTIFYYHKKAGGFALLLASIIAFSRMYLFVHYPTDILGGILFGLGTALLAVLLVKKVEASRSFIRS